MGRTGNSKSVFATMGASNHSETERQKNDYYATEPLAVELLLAKEKFSRRILEPACGEGHISKVLKRHGYDVISSDVIDYGFGGVQNFFNISSWGGDIITNPPYKLAKEFVQHALDIIPAGRRVAMFLKLTFLESKERQSLFKENPPDLSTLQSNGCNAQRMATLRNSAAVLVRLYATHGLSGKRDLKVNR